MGLLKKLAKGALKLANPINAVKALNPKNAAKQIGGVAGILKKKSAAPAGGVPAPAGGAPGGGGLMSRLNIRKRV